VGKLWKVVIDFEQEQTEITECPIALCLLNLLLLKNFARASAMDTTASNDCLDQCSRAAPLPRSVYPSTTVAWAPARAAMHCPLGCIARWDGKKKMRLTAQACSVRRMASTFFLASPNNIRVLSL
jgi:hypothetical protein